MTVVGNRSKNSFFIFFLIGKKWIYLERNTFHLIECGPSQEARGQNYFHFIGDVIEELSSLPKIKMSKVNNESVIEMKLKALSFLLIVTFP